MTVDPYVLKLSGYLALMFFSGYFTGVIFRVTKQFLEKVAS